MKVLAFPDKGLNGLLGFLDQSRMGCLNANRFGDIQIGAILSFGSFPANKVNAKAWMPSARIAAK